MLISLGSFAAVARSVNTEYRCLPRFQICLHVPEPQSDQNVGTSCNRARHTDGN